MLRAHTRPCCREMIIEILFTFKCLLFVCVYVMILSFLSNGFPPTLEEIPFCFCNGCNYSTGLKIQTFPVALCSPRSQPGLVG